MVKIEEILKLNKKDYKKFIEENIYSFEGLKYFCPQREYNGLIKTKDFLSFNSMIVTGWANFVLDDESCYFILLDNVKEMLDKKHFSNSKQKLENISKCIQKSVFDYYGYGKPNDYKRMLIYKDAYDRGFDVSMKTFKNSGNSWCTERASLVHNFFKFLGIESVLASSNIEILGGKDLHVYNFIRFDGKCYLFDLLNTPHMLDKPLPQIVLQEIDKEIEETIFNDKDRIDNYKKIEVSTISQSGRKYSITYGNDKECERED